LITTAQAIALVVGLTALALLAIAGGVRTLLDATNDITDQDEGTTTE
jgi:hypothetical protein